MEIIYICTLLQTYVAMYIYKMYAWARLNSRELHGVPCYLLFTFNVNKKSTYIHYLSFSLSFAYTKITFYISQHLIGFVLMLLLLLLYFFLILFLFVILTCKLLLFLHFIWFYSLFTNKHLAVPLFTFEINNKFEYLSPAYIHPSIKPGKRAVKQLPLRRRLALKDIYGFIC